MHRAIAVFNPKKAVVVMTLEMCPHKLNMCYVREETRSENQTFSKLKKLG